MDDFIEQLTERLLEDGILQPDSNVPDDDAIDDYWETAEFAEYDAYKNKVLEPYVTHHEKTSLRAYQMFHACHWWNPTFGLTLAKAVCPRETWSVRWGKNHTTVVNADLTKVFDILYFDPEDPTFGGTHAIAQSAEPSECR